MLFSTSTLSLGFLVATLLQGSIAECPLCANSGTGFDDSLEFDISFLEPNATEIEDSDLPSKCSDIETVIDSVETEEDCGYYQLISHAYCGCSLPPDDTCMVDSLGKPFPDPDKEIIDPSGESVTCRDLGFGLTFTKLFHEGLTNFFGGDNITTVENNEEEDEEDDDDKEDDICAYSAFLCGEPQCAVCEYGLQEPDKVLADDDGNNFTCTQISSYFESVVDCETGYSTLRYYGCLCVGDEQEGLCTICENGLEDPNKSVFVEEGTAIGTNFTCAEGVNYLESMSDSSDCSSQREMAASVGCVCNACTMCENGLQDPDKLISDGITCAEAVKDYESENTCYLGTLDLSSRGCLCNVDDLSPACTICEDGIQEPDKVNTAEDGSTYTCAEAFEYFETSDRCKEGSEAMSSVGCLCIGDEPEPPCTICEDGIENPDKMNTAEDGSTFTCAQGFEHFESMNDCDSGYTSMSSVGCLCIGDEPEPPCTICEDGIENPDKINTAEDGSTYTCAEAFEYFETIDRCKEGSEAMSSMGCLCIGDEPEQPKTCKICEDGIGDPNKVITTDDGSTYTCAEGLGYFESVNDCEMGYFLMRSLGCLCVGDEYCTICEYGLQNPNKIVTLDEETPIGSSFTCEEGVDFFQSNAVASECSEERRLAEAEGCFCNDEDHEVKTQKYSKAKSKKAYAKSTKAYVKSDKHDKYTKSDKHNKNSKSNKYP